jgi:hypothetical protein
MQSGKSTNKSNKSVDQNPGVPDTASSVETSKPRNRAAQAAGSSESKRITKSASNSSASSAQAGAANSDKATSKATHRRATKHVAPKTAETADVTAGAPVKQAGAPLAMAAVAGSPKSVDVGAAAHTVTQNEIAERAYSYFVARRYQAGNPYEDWLRAERELRSRKQA